MTGPVEAMLLAIPVAALASAVVKNLKYSLAALIVHALLCTIAPALGEPSEAVPALAFSVAAVAAVFAAALRVLPSYEAEPPVTGSWILVVFAAVPVVWASILGLPSQVLVFLVSAALGVYMISIRRNLVKASYGLVAFENSLHGLLSQEVHIGPLMETPLSAVVFLTALLSSVLALMVYKTVGSLDTSGLRRLEW